MRWEEALQMSKQLQGQRTYFLPAGAALMGWNENTNGMRFNSLSPGRFKWKFTCISNFQTKLNINSNSNSNSRGFNSNSNSNSGKSPEYQLQLQLQLRRFQLQLQFQLRQISRISTPTPTPTPEVSTPTPIPTPEISTPIPTPDFQIQPQLHFKSNQSCSTKLPLPITVWNIVWIKLRYAVDICHVVPNLDQTAQHWHSRW